MLKYEENKHQVIVERPVPYTAAQEKEMRLAYQAEDTQDERDAVIEELSLKYTKPIKSIIAKLSKMKNKDGTKVYIPKVHLSKLTKEKPETKQQLVTRLELKHNNTLESLIKASKRDLLVLLGEYKGC